jgi:uncharacterized protein (DUF302 family)
MEGIKTIESAFGPKDTMDRLEAAVRARGMTVFLRLDHAAGAAQAGFFLRPTELMIFGSARSGTPLMHAKQTIGLDLPLKVLVWQDATDRTWLAYNDPLWIVARHGAGAEANPLAANMATVLADLSALAGKPGDPPS